MLGCRPFVDTSLLLRLSLILVGIHLILHMLLHGLKLFSYFTGSSENRDHKIENDFI